MALVTGSPQGNVIAQEELYVEGAPYVYFQDYRANLLNNPDANGYYWGLSGTSTYPVYQIGCIQDVSFGDNTTVNAVRCDTIGDKDVIQKRNHLELKLTVLTQFPFSILAKILNFGSSVFTATGLEKTGIGQIDNTQLWHAYCPKVYDDVDGDYVLFNLHRAKFVNAWTMEFKFGAAWQVTGLEIWAFADENKPAAQRFATLVRSDLGALP
jgi:hypothetical protein